MKPEQTTEIQAEVVKIPGLFAKGVFYVPWHQRYYDWEAEQVSALLNDIHDAVTRESKHYFLGAVILLDQENGRWEITDGQQRMVTLSLICAALCRKFSTDSLRTKIALKILFDPKENVPARSESEKYDPRIEPPDHYGMSYRQIIRGNTIGTNGKLTTAWRTIDEFFESSGGKKYWKKYFDYLCDHLEIACLTVPGKVDPNEVFETINCRGKPLEEVDLIRNFIYSHFNEADEKNRRKTVHESLERIQEVFKQPTKASEYIRCRMQCEFGYLSKQKFYRDLRTTIFQHGPYVLPGRRRNNFIFNLVKEISSPLEIELFNRLLMPSPPKDFAIDFESKSRTTNSPRKLSVYLQELRPYKVTHPLLFAFLLKFVREEDGRIKRGIAKRVNRSISRLSTFVLRTAFVTSKFEPSHYDKKFSNFAKEILGSNAIPDQKFAEFLKDCDRDRHNVLDDDVFIDYMSDAIMRTGGMAKIQTLLLGLNREGNRAATLLVQDQCSIEHILPASPDHWRGWDGFLDVDPVHWANKLGNLTLVSKSDNRPGQKHNIDFSTKKAIYKESSFAITRDLSKVDHWSPEAISKRQRKMAKKAASIWKFN